MAKGKREQAQKPWWSYCPTGKTRFGSFQSANSALGKILDAPRRGFEDTPTHYYHCTLCDGWHVTSKPRPNKSFPYRPDLDEQVSAEQARQRAEMSARLAGTSPGDPHDDELFSAEEGLDQIVAAHVDAARKAFNTHFHTDVTGRMFRPMLMEALNRVRQKNKEGVYCTNPSDPRHDGETCPSNHEE